MKIAVVDYYGSGILYKDPAQITLGLRDIGVDAIFVARNSVSQLDAALAPFPVLASKDIETKNFWVTISVDAVLIISRLAPDAAKIVKAVKAAGLRLILKADSDGTLGFPLAPNYLRTLSWRQDPLRTLLRYAKWRLPIRRYVGKKIDQIAMADAVIVESPKARSNILSILQYWGCTRVGSKVHFVPNPVAPDVFAVNVATEKQKLVLAVGRWDDAGPKNTAVMVEALVYFLRARWDYRAVIVGAGHDVVARIAAQLDKDSLERLDIIGPMDHSHLAQRLAHAQILFMPSRIESFGIVAAEALCVGCSIAVTPVESLDYLAADGFAGTVASGFDTLSVKEALFAEAKRWDAGERNPHAIAAYWRAQLNRQKVAASVLAIIAAASLAGA